jgi:hypothetical protein
MNSSLKDIGRLFGNLSTPSAKCLFDGAGKFLAIELKNELKLFASILREIYQPLPD